MIAGLTEFISDVNTLTKKLNGQEMVDTVHKVWDVMRDQIDANAASEGFFDTGLLLDPESIITVSGMRHDGTVFADAGVYKHDATMMKYGLDPKKDMPRPMVAYWLEFGTQAHYLTKGIRVGETKEFGPLGGSSPNLVLGIKPSRFITKAYELKINEAIDKFTGVINRKLEEV